MWEAALRRPSAQSSLIQLTAKSHEAESSANAWPDALASLTDALGGGAACIVFNKKNNRADWVCFSGLSAALETRYMHYYASLDPFSPLLQVVPGWTKLSECLPQAALLKSEWYNDFVLACGVRDIVATRLVDTESHWTVLGLHQQIGRSFRHESVPILDHVTAQLRAATARYIERLLGRAHDHPTAEIAVQRARYFFHVSNGTRYSDESGKEFATREDAIASILVEDLRRDKGWDGFEVSVSDEAGAIVARKRVRA
jgi:hypothetical protein